TSVQDYGQWDMRAAVRTSDVAPRYVAGPTGDSALSLTSGSDYVMLTPSAVQALQFDETESFTLQLVFRTSPSNAVLLGSLPSDRNWSLQLIGGKLQFSLFDKFNLSTIISASALNDGAWHQVAAVRDVATHQLRLYVDRVQAANPVSDTTLYTMVRSD